MFNTTIHLILFIKRSSPSDYLSLYLLIFFVCVYILIKILQWTNRRSFSSGNTGEKTSKILETAKVGKIDIVSEQNPKSKIIYDKNLTTYSTTNNKSAHLVIINRNSADHIETFSKNYLSKSRPWTKKEHIELINEIAAGTKVNLIAQNHNRTTGAVQTRIRKLKNGKGQLSIRIKKALVDYDLSSNPITTKKSLIEVKKEWTKIEEKELVDSLYKKMNISEISIKINRTPSEVQEQINHLSKKKEKLLSINRRGGAIIQEAEKLLDQYEIRGIYHMSHFSNIEKIIKYGILSHNNVEALYLKHEDISDNQVNDRRRRNEPIYNKPIHDYAPFYFNHKNPMLFRRINIQHEIAIIEIDRSAIYQYKGLITDGNAAAQPTRFFSGMDSLSQLDWNCLMADNWNEIPDGKRKRCAEVLILGRVPSSRIKNIFCFSEGIEKIIKPACYDVNIPVKIKKNMYFY